MKKRQLSVIIPCYNVEEYIEKCLDSLVSQVSKYEYEIILVNDCSKDNTEKEINKYIKKHKDINIVFINNEVNSGAGFSRNRAVEIAKYDNISFIDSDDFVDDKFYEELFETMDRENADVVVCDINCVFDDGSAPQLYPCCFEKVSKLNLVNNGFSASPCNKLIKKELLLKYPFAEGIMNEDIAAIIPIIIKANKVAYTENTRYNYLQRSSSVQNTRLSDKRLDLFKAVNIVDDIIKDEKDYDFYIHAIVYQQIILFFMYVPPRENSFFRRGHFLKKFYKLSKRYNLRKNRHYNIHMTNSGKKTRFYYKTIMKLNCTGFSYTTSFIISSYLIYRNLKRKIKVIKKNITLNDLVKCAKKQSKMKSEKTVSVVIPNYNYADFMNERFYSILNQTYKINEIIILDDCSKDNSIEVLDEIASLISPYIKVIKEYNKENSGCVFNQWEKGFKLAISDYVWIAEADDYCNKNMLKENMKQILSDDEVVLSYCDTAFIDKTGYVTMKTIKPEIDIMKTKHWNTSYITDGKKEIKNYSYLNCTIANVSSVIFKNGDYKDIFKAAKKFRQVGDWRFYLGIYELGKVSFINKPLNYYRVHGNNVTSTTKKQKHYNEIKKLHKEYRKKIKFTKQQEKEIQKRYEFLKKIWLVED